MQLQREAAERIALAGGEPARELIVRLFDQVAEQGERLAEQGERLEKVEHKRGRARGTARCPPSTDRGSPPEQPQRERSERKQGGQSGPSGASRELVGDPDQTVAHAIQHRNGREDLL